MKKSIKNLAISTKEIKDLHTIKGGNKGKTSGGTTSYGVDDVMIYVL